MRNTNFQNLKELLKNYTPKTIGVATVEECNLIRDSLQLDGMEIIGKR